MAFLGLFSDKAEFYAAARPRYPDELFEFVTSVALGNKCAWDCAEFKLDPRL